MSATCSRWRRFASKVLFAVDVGPADFLATSLCASRAGTGANKNQACAGDRRFRIQVLDPRRTARVISGPRVSGLMI